MRRQLIRLASGILCGLMAATFGFGEVVVYEDFEGAVDCWNACQGVQTLQTIGDYSTYYYGETDYEQCKMESNEDVPIGVGTVIQFDAQMPFQSAGYPWALIAIGTDRDTTLDVKSFHCGVYVSGYDDSAYVFAGGSYRRAEFHRAVWHTIRAEVKDDGYMELFIDGIRAARTTAPIPEGKPAGPAVVAANGIKIDNVIFGTEPTDMDFGEDFEDDLDGWFHDLAGFEEANLQTTTDSSGNSFHPSGTDTMGTSIVSMRSFQITSNLDLSFDAKVPQTEDALVIVGFIEADMDVDDPQGTAVPVVGISLNGLGKIGWYGEDYYDEDDGVDGQWHAYTVKMIHHDFLAVYRDGYILDTVEINSQCFGNMLLAISSKNAYVDNISVK